MTDVSAFAAYTQNNNKKRNKRKRKNKAGNRHSPEILIADDDDGQTPDVQEIQFNESSVPGQLNFLNDKKRKSNGFVTNPVNVEVIDIEENSDDVIMIENGGKGKNKRKKLMEDSQDEVVFEGPVNGEKSKNSVEDAKVDEDVENRVNIPSSSETKSSKLGKKKKKSKGSGGNEIPIKDYDDDEEYSGNSLVEAKKLFSWLISPVETTDFFRNTWERRPLFIKRAVKEYYSPLLSTPEIDKMLRNNIVEFTKHLDVTTYVNGKRETHNPEGRALPSMVWDYYRNGCSVRLLNPQSFIPKLALLNTSLQEHFGCFVGANAYLTPPDSQGFAPHYDDIEAFILQVEGKKEWKLYAPRTDSHILPRESSGNFSQDEIGSPLMEVTLEPGDLLYFPRGTIHQGRTVPGDHSLHITLSCFQKNTWGDIMEKVLSGALRVAMEDDLEFRRGLPREYLNYMGIVHSETESPQRSAFIEKINYLVKNLIKHAPIDAAVDQMGKQFMHDAMPPVLTAEEKACTAFGDGFKMGKNGKLIANGAINGNTKVKLLRAHILRLVTEENAVRLYHCLDNSLEYHGNEPQFLELPVEMAPAVECLIHSYPDFIKVSQLPLENADMQIRIIHDLWDRGLLLTENPLKKPI